MQGGAQALEGRLDGLQAGRHHLPVRLAFEGHEIEGSPHRLLRAVQYPHRAEVVADLVKSQTGRQPLGHHVGGHPVGVGRLRGGGDRRQGGALQFGSLVEAGGRKVRKAVVVPRDTPGRGLDGVDGRHPGDVGIGRR